MRWYLFVLLLSLVTISSCTPTHSPQKEEINIEYLPMNWHICGSQPSWDPASLLSNPDISRQIYRYLFTIDEAGQFYSDLCEEYTFKEGGLLLLLKKKQFFQDHPDFYEERGREISAYDVVFSIQRALNHVHQRPEARQLFQYCTPDDITALSKFEVWIPFTEKIGDLPYLLSAPAFGIIPHECFEGQVDPECPAGSGQFRLMKKTSGNGYGLFKQFNPEDSLREDRPLVINLNFQTDSCSFTLEIDSLPEMRSCDHFFDSLNFSRWGRWTQHPNFQHYLKIDTLYFRKKELADTGSTPLSAVDWYQYFMGTDHFDLPYIPLNNGDTLLNDVWAFTPRMMEPSSLLEALLNQALSETDREFVSKQIKELKVLSPGYQRQQKLQFILSNTQTLLSHFETQRISCRKHIINKHIHGFRLHPLGQLHLSIVTLHSHSNVDQQLDESRVSNK